MGAKRGQATVTLRHVAEVAGVSAQTVSCVVNNTGSVSDDVRVRVREIADRLGYRPNLYAKAMRTGRSRTIGLVISDIRSPFFPTLAHEMQKVTQMAGYSLLIVETDGTPDLVADRISTLRSLGVDGIVATEAVPALFDLRIPTVMLAETSRALDSVTADDLAGGKMIAEHLLGRGHRKIALVTSPREGCVQRRREGLLARLKGEAEIVWEVTTPETDAITQDVRRKLLKPGVTAIVCSTDEIAISVMHALRELSISVPHDVSVVGFDDVQWSSIVTPGLTTVRQPFAELVKHSVGLLLERIDKPKRRPRQVKLPVVLVERDSVATVKTRDRRNTIPREQPEPRRMRQTTRVL